MSSTYIFPSLLPSTNTEEFWFPKTSEEYESNLDAIEREEESFKAKLYNIANTPAPQPIGAASSSSISFSSRRKDDEQRQHTDTRGSISSRLMNAARASIDVDDDDDDDEISVDGNHRLDDGRTSFEQEHESFEYDQLGSRLVDVSETMDFVEGD